MALCWVSALFGGGSVIRRGLPPLLSSPCQSYELTGASWIPQLIPAASPWKNTYKAANSVSCFKYQSTASLSASATAARNSAELRSSKPNELTKAAGSKFTLASKSSRPSAGRKARQASAAAAAASWSRGHPRRAASCYGVRARSA